MLYKNIIDLTQLTMIIIALVFLSLAFSFALVSALFLLYEKEKIAKTLIVISVVLAIGVMVCFFIDVFNHITHNI